MRAKMLNKEFPKFVSRGNNWNNTQEEIGA